MWAVFILLEIELGQLLYRWEAVAWNRKNLWHASRIVIRGDPLGGNSKKPVLQGRTGFLHR